MCGDETGQGWCFPCWANCLFVGNANCDCKQHLWGAFKVLKCTLQKRFFYMQLVCSWHIILIYSLKYVPGLVGSILWIIDLGKFWTGWSLKVIQFTPSLVVAPLSNIHAWPSVISDPIQWEATLDLLWQPLERPGTLEAGGPASNPSFSPAGVPQ